MSLRLELCLLFIHPRASPLTFSAVAVTMPSCSESLLGSFISAFKTRRSLALENLALRPQLAVRKRCVKRSRLTDLDRGFWVLLRRVWTDWDNVLVIVKPETVVRWHRAGFRRYWTWKSRKRRPGRPGVALEVRELIRDMCRANPLWGAPRVHEARHLHFPGCGVQVHDSASKTTVSDVAELSRQPR